MHTRTFYNKSKFFNIPKSLNIELNFFYKYTKQRHNSLKMLIFNFNPFSYVNKYKVHLSFIQRRKNWGFTYFKISKVTFEWCLLNVWVVKLSIKCIEECITCISFKHCMIIQGHIKRSKVKYVTTYTTFIN